MQKARFSHFCSALLLGMRRLLLGSEMQSWRGASHICKEESRACCVKVHVSARPTQVGKLHSVLRPFMLRRIKADVEHSLPLKSEILLYAHMAPDQKRINDQLRDRTLHVRNDTPLGATLLLQCNPAMLVVSCSRQLLSMLTASGVERAALVCVVVVATFC